MSIKIYPSDYTPGPDLNYYDDVNRDIRLRYPNYQNENVEDSIKTGGSVLPPLKRCIDTNCNSYRIERRQFEVVCPYCGGDLEILEETEIVETKDSYSQVISPISSPTDIQGFKDRYAKVFIQNTNEKSIERPVVYLKSGATKSFISIATIDPIGWYTSQFQYRYGGELYDRCMYIFSNPLTLDDAGNFDDWVPVFDCPDCDYQTDGVSWPVAEWLTPLERTEDYPYCGSIVPAGIQIKLGQKNLDDIISAMTNVVHGARGTARRLKKGINYQIAGKTGTAQVFTVKQEEEYNEDEIDFKLRDHALFMAFAPADNPKIAIAVIVEHGGHGGSVAAPIAGKIMKQFLMGAKKKELVGAN